MASTRCYWYLVLLATECYRSYASCVDTNGTIPPPSGATRQMADGCTEFGIDLLRSITAQLFAHDVGGVAISPYGIWSALLITYIGSGTKTMVELEKILGVAKLTKSQVANSRSLLNRSHPSYVSVSRLYVQRGLTLAQCTRRTSEGDVVYTDFSNDPESARRDINGWIEAVTRNKIHSFLPASSLDGGTKILLANAVYFQSVWTMPFNTKKTRRGNFTVSLGERVQVGMMSNTGFYKYAVSRELQISAVQLPYGERGDVAMLILLPDHPYFGLKVLDGEISAERLKELRRSLRYARVCVELPKFKLERGYQLVEPLRSMGIRTLFSKEEADLTDLVVGGRGYVAVDKVQHRMAIDVSENGTVAVGATSARFEARTAHGWPVPFTVDHPFFFVIVDLVTDVPLFMGAVWRPTSY